MINNDLIRFILYWRMEPVGTLLGGNQSNDRLTTITIGPTIISYLTTVHRAGYTMKNVLSIVFLILINVLQQLSQSIDKPG